MVLRAINILGRRLADREEALLGSDPEACYLYSVHVLKGRLPDHLHNKMVLEVWEDERHKEAVSLYIRDFAGNKKVGTI